MLQSDPFGRARVDVRFPIGHDDDVVAVQLAPQRRAKRLLIPDALAAVERPVLALQIADQLAQVTRDRPQLRGGHGPGRSQDALAAQQRAQPLHPAAPRQLRDDDGDQRDRGAQRREEIEKVSARLLAAASDEAHVVDEHELRPRKRLAVDGTGGDMEWPSRRLQHLLAAFRIGIRPQATRS